MAAKSSFIPRLSFSRGDPLLFPLRHRQQHPLRSKPSEYDLADLSPRPEDALLSPESEQESANSVFISGPPRTLRMQSPPADLGDGDSTSGSTSKMKPRVLFAGPPPPIAKSTLLYRDEEDRGPTTRRQTGELPGPTRNPISSILFNRTPPSSQEHTSAFSPDSVWRGFQTREKSLQKDLQRFLDIQAASLSAELDRPLDPSPSPGPAASEAGSSTPTDTFYTSHSRLEMDRSTSNGEVIPVRQPRPRKVGLRGARSGLARTMALLAGLKAEEDASLASALSARKRALVQLRKLSARQDGISGELRSLEGDDEEPLARELKDLGDEHGEIRAQISEMEGRLVKLKKRKHLLEERIEDVNNRREAGLSGYRGALKEVEGQVAVILKRPPVRPLDL